MQKLMQPKNALVEILVIPLGNITFLIKVQFSNALESIDETGNPLYVVGMSISISCVTSDEKIQSEILYVLEESFQENTRE